MNETISSDQGAPSAATPDPDPAGPRASRRLVRHRDGRVLGGVCAGVAGAVGLDVAVVRLLTVLATVMIAFGPGTLLAGVLTYAALWFILPDEHGSSAVEGLVRRLRGQASPPQSAPTAAATTPPAPAQPRPGQPTT